MKIVVIGGTNGFEPEVPDGDMLICTGDFSSFAGTRGDVERFNAWLGRLPHKYKIVVPGDRDAWCSYSDRMTKEVLSNAVVLIDTGVEIAGLKIYGTPWIPDEIGRTEVTGNAFGTTDPYLELKFSYIPEDLDILVTHCPGDNTILITAVDRTKPRLHVCGHGARMYNAADEPVGAAVCVVLEPR
jgi:hypothetical protein